MSEKLNYALFYIFLFFLPWQTVFIIREVTLSQEKFQYGTIGIYFFEIILFSWILLNIHIFKNYNHKKILFYILIFFIYSSLSIFWATDKLLSFYYLVAMLLGTSSFLILQKKLLNFKKFTFILIFSIFLQGVLGINQFLTQAIPANKWLGIAPHIAWQGGTSVIETPSERFLRAYGGMPHPNILGGFLIIAILLGIGAYMKTSSKEKTWKYFLLISIFVNFFSLIVTFSRSAMLSLILGILLFFIYYLYNKHLLSAKKLLFFTIVFATIGILFYSLFHGLFTNRLNATSRLEKKSVNERIAFLQEAKNIITQKPIFGTGMGNYTSFLIKNSTQKEVWRFQPVHNIYLLIFAELGVVGFSLFMFVIIFIVYDFFESFRKENTNRVIFSIIIISLLLLSFFDHWTWTNHSGIIISWILLNFSREKDLNQD